MPSEGREVSESSNDSLELVEIAREVATVGHARLDLGNEVGEGFETGNDVIKVLLLEVSDGGLSIRDDTFSILDALLDVSEALGLNSALKESFDDLDHHLNVNFDGFLLRLFTEEELGRGVSDIVTEVVPGLGVEILDATVNIIVDIDTIEKEILSNVPAEAGWGGEGLDHLNNVLDILWNGGTVTNGRFDGSEHFCDLTKTIHDTSSALLLEVDDGGVSISEDLVSILDAASDIHALSIEGTSEETFCELDDIGDGHLNLLLGLFLAQELADVLLGVPLAISNLYAMGLIFKIKAVVGIGTDKKSSD
jgi:hypothetical protein